MIRIFSLTILLIISSTVLNGDNKPKEKPVLKQIAGLNVIKTIYPEAESVEKANTVWFKILSGKGDLLGYALSSKPFTTGVNGYHKTTPVVIVMDTNKVIQKTAILSHWETAAFIKKLERQNFFDSWNGLKVEEALKKRAKVDSYTGATVSARALMKNMDVILEMAVKDKLRQ